MLKAISVNKKWVIFAGIFIVLILAWFIFSFTDSDESAHNEHSYVIHLVTGEFKTETEDGEEIEAYRWDPGTIFVPEGEQVQLRIYGVNGDEHPFMIEGTDIRGTVKKGEETVLNLRFNKEGVYRLICLTHPDIQSNGPMIGYIVVD